MTLNILLIQITIFYNYYKQHCCVSLHTFMTKRQMPAVKFHVSHFAVSREEIVSNVSREVSVLLLLPKCVWNLFCTDSKPELGLVEKKVK